jgi:hypothetical protein
MFVRIKDFTIYIPSDAEVTIVVTKQKQEVEEQDDHLTTKLQDMLEDHD